MKIYKFGCEMFTPFAPHWEYLIAEEDSKGDYTPLKNEILKRENEIIDEFEYEHDWGTGLGKNSLTARSNKYNLLEFENAGPLREDIRKFHDGFIEHIGLSMTGPIFVQCWANVMRKGAKIAIHCHGFSPHSYLSGHVCVQVTDTQTHYYNPYAVEPWSSDNKAGKMTLFPTWLKHGTDRVKDDEERITIAFDIMDERGYTESVKEDMKPHWVKL
tara:strand:+ start:4304 stop:4948 length:645 start_codon:yes stop_codon:yes gene_type:complete